MALDARPQRAHPTHSMSASIDLAPGTEENGMASMLAELVRQNLAQKPHKVADFASLVGAAAIVAEDAAVSLTLRFDHGALTIHDGIVGMPHVTIRGESESILAMSNLPLTRWGAMPLTTPET